jgi:hypothetical protein
VPTPLHTSRPYRSKIRYGGGDDEGYYAKLAKGKLPGQSFYMAHLVELPLPEQHIELALSVAKIDYDIDTHRRPDIPKNFR